MSAGSQAAVLDATAWLWVPFVDVRNLGRVATSSKQLAEDASDANMWKEMVVSRWHVLPSRPIRTYGATSWRNVYRNFIFEQRIPRCRLTRNHVVFARGRQRGVCDAWVLIAHRSDCRTRPLNSLSTGSENSGLESADRAPDATAAADASHRGVELRLVLQNVSPAALKLDLGKTRLLMLANANSRAVSQGGHGVAATPASSAFAAMPSFKTSMAFFSPNLVSEAPRNPILIFGNEDAAASLEPRPGRPRRRGTRSYKDKDPAHCGEAHTQSHCLATLEDVRRKVARSGAGGAEVSDSSASESGEQELEDGNSSDEDCPVRGTELAPMQFAIFSLFFPCPGCVYETDFLVRAKYLNVGVKFRPTPSAPEERSTFSANFVDEGSIWSHYQELPGGFMVLTADLGGSSGFGV